MRRLIATAILTLTGGSAMASSVEYISGVHVANGSFVRLDCDGCEPVKDDKVVETYAIPSIPPGTQYMEMRDVEGKRTLVRTEAWLGGAPVTFVSTNPAWMPQDARPQAVADDEGGQPKVEPAEAADVPAEIDEETKTAAVNEISAETAVVPESASLTATPDFADVELRGN